MSNANSPTPLERARAEGIFTSLWGGKPLCLDANVYRAWRQKFGVSKQDVDHAVNLLAVEGRITLEPGEGGLITLQKVGPDILPPLGQKKEECDLVSLN